MEMFKKFELPNAAISKINGGANTPNNDASPNNSEDVPITKLGTITNEGEG